MPKRSLSAAFPASIFAGIAPASSSRSQPRASPSCAARPRRAAATPSPHRSPGGSTSEQTVEYLIDLIAAVQTGRSCLSAAEHEPEFTAAGHCFPGHAHLAAGGIALLKARQRIAEILRTLPGSRWSSRRPNATSRHPSFPRASTTPSAAAATPRSSVRHCCSLPPTTSRRRSMRANPPSSCMRAAACRCGGIGCDAAFATTCPPDLPPRPLMVTDFAARSQLVRPGRPHIRCLSIGPRFCSTLPSGPAWQPGTLLRDNRFAASSGRGFP